MDKFLLKCSYIKHKKSSTELNFGKINFDDEEIVYLVKPQSYGPHSYGPHSYGLFSQTSAKVE